MFKDRIALVLGALAMTWAAPAIAQSPQGTAAGTLTRKAGDGQNVRFVGRRSDKVTDL